ncbi:hypothetical protein [Micromonospora deserti]|uniref:Uncharacterized protein n=1 Tax=Micromonospora deserti TaxID=2070366 RepID=A0A2W2BSA1_9ACTN|nr:hypothetical protein [Micromonospora deserti]PZF89072.1 hypothetical protein C1I99_25805 [Micromonospora deserti]
MTLQLEDGRSFVDIALAPELPGPLPQMESFRRYRAGLEDRCEERSTSGFTTVGSYGFGNDRPARPVVPVRAARGGLVPCGA